MPQGEHFFQGTPSVVEKAKGQNIFEGGREKKVTQTAAHTKRHTPKIADVKDVRPEGELPTPEGPRESVS